jgi:hypothetical protein
VGDGYVFDAAGWAGLVNHKVCKAAEAGGHKYPLPGSPVVASHFLKHPIDHANKEVHVAVLYGAKAVYKGHSFNMQGRLVHAGRIGLPMAVCELRCV